MWGSAEYVPIRAENIPRGFWARLAIVLALLAAGCSGSAGPHVRPPLHTYGFQSGGRLPALYTPLHVSSGTRGPGGWRELGPTYASGANEANPKTGARTGVSGRVNALAVDPTTCRGTTCGTIYLGAASGGVWKTVDGGKHWASLTDSERDLYVGSIALDPTDPRIVYVGTGDSAHWAKDHGGIGILRSTDGGKKWTDLGYNQFHDRSVSAIIVDPRRAGTAQATIYATSAVGERGAATTGGGYVDDAPNLPTLGFYVSTDGGQTWALSNPRHIRHDPTGGTEAQNLVMDRRNPNILYAAYNYGGIFRSKDDGASWTRLTAGLPRKDFSYVQIAQAMSDPDVLYAAFDVKARHGPRESLFHTLDGGSHWTGVASPNACDDQCSSNMVLAVDPSTPWTVFAGGTANYDYLFRTSASSRPRCEHLRPLASACQATVAESKDGGKTWADITENGDSGPVHPDDHAILVDPKNAAVLYLGTDGGLFRSTNGGRSWTDLNRGLGTFQARSLSLGPQGEIYIGTQDNGTLKYMGNHWWLQFGHADGGFTAADPVNDTVVYFTHDRASLYRNDAAGQPGQDIYIAPFWADYDKAGRGQDYEPYGLDPSRPTDIFYGTYRVWRSELRGGIDGNGDGDATNDRSDRSDWVPISFDLSCKRVPARPSRTCDNADNAGQGISTLAISPTNANLVVAATANSHIWLTHNALARVRTDTGCDPRFNREHIARCHFVSGVNWIRIDQGLPRRFPTAVRFGPHSSLIAAYSGFDADTPRHPGHLFISTDLGHTWKNLSRGLPDVPLTDALVNPANGHIYAAGDPGLYASADGGASWQRVDAGLPGASVFQMQYDSRRRLLAVATFGRGVWERLAP